MRKELTLFFLLTLFSLVTVVAETSSLDDVAQFDCTTLKQKYANSTYSNITTISYPNNTEIVLNTPMSGSNGIWSYEFCDTSQLGSYEYCTRIDVDGVPTDACIDFEVTPDGLNNTLGFYFLILILSLGVIVFGSYVSDATIVLLGSFGLYFIGLYILFNGIAGVKDAVYTWGLGIILLGLAFYASVKAAHSMITD